MKITFIADTHHYSKTLGIAGKAYELQNFAHYLLTGGEINNQQATI